MKTITVHHPHSMKKEDFPPLVMALGYFDGVHKGHQQVIESAKKYAEKHYLKTAVMTFDPHPSVVLGRKHQHVRYITPLDEKLEVFEQLGIDLAFVVRFTSDFAGLSPQEYVDQYIISLHVQHVVAGFDYTYGRLGKGTMESLPFHSRQAFSQTVVPKLTEKEEKVSSTLIRKSIASGDMEKVNILLGRPYRTKGTVVHGDKRGRKIGFPTANIEQEDNYLLPNTGVYTVQIKVHDTWYNGVCNVGYKPTFKHPDEKKLTIEVHIFTFDHSIYGEEIQLKWYDRIRSEQKFNGINELIDQIEKDKETANQFFEKYKH
ncbi:bifunctional riboflavin kinase/FAD synthetase [Bacillus sp. 2205SS5-2]|uniref:bifunctional riboflavin kinase/FAD synthetase n=1 Tax=Bacillus sp. 2205SS5-2 TaxID=3109031 RepID=UPI00300739A1